jgi:Na+/H+-translocating membrane pyrophosphatase
MYLYHKFISRLINIAGTTIIVIVGDFFKLYDGLPLRVVAQDLCLSTMISIQNGLRIGSILKITPLSSFDPFASPLNMP